MPSDQAGPEKSADAMVAPVCAKPGPHLRRIGWGKFGLQFDVPTREVDVLGGKPDVDYVRYVIKPKAGDGYLEFWFGPYAFNSNPDAELLENSVATGKRDIVSSSGEQTGKDSWGKLKDGEVWRHTFLQSEAPRERGTKPRQRMRPSSTELSILPAMSPLRDDRR